MNMRHKTQKVRRHYLIIALAMLALALCILGVIITQAEAADTPPDPQHVQLEPSGTVYIIGDCHMTIEVNGANSLQVTCTADKGE